MNFRLGGCHSRGGSEKKQEIWGGGERKLFHYWGFQTAGKGRVTNNYYLGEREERHGVPYRSLNIRFYPTERIVIVSGESCKDKKAGLRPAFCLVWWWSDLIESR